MADPDPIQFAATTPLAVHDLAHGATVPLGAAAGGDDVLSATARVGRLALLRKLGEGGMGVVYAAYDEALDRRVAVKVLKPGVAAAAWLVREAQALARLSHPNVVPVYDVGEHEGGVFLAMEFVEGRTLRAFAEEPERSFEDVARALAQAGKGLAAAHEAGLIHRDFKPENVLVGKDGRARVVDFGIAGMAEGGAAGVLQSASDADRPVSSSPTALASSLTQVGALVGTPAYMAPEQYLGQRATAASDQWSFAVTLYEVAYGKLPFDGAMAVQLMASIVAGRMAPPPPGSSVPPWVLPLVTRALSRDPKDRFPSISALVAAMEAALPAAHDDPSRVRKEQLILFGTLAVYGFGAMTYITLRGQEKALATSFDLLKLGTAFSLVAVIAVAIVWKKLRENSHGRRLAFFFAGTPIAMLLHRLVAAGLGEPVLHTLVMDIFLMSLAFGLTALIVERRLFAVTVLGAFAIVAATLYPNLASPLFGTVGMFGLGLGVYYWGRDARRAQAVAERSSSTLRSKRG